MKKIVVSLTGCVLALILTNCGSITPGNIIDKTVKIMKIHLTDEQFKKLETFLDAKKKSEYENKIKADCNEDDLKKADARLDCFQPAHEAGKKAADDKDNKALEAAKAAIKKCDDMPKPRPKCATLVKAIADEIDQEISKL